MTANNLVMTLYDGARTGTEPLMSCTGQGDLASALGELATSIRCNPLWRLLPNARLVARSSPVPLLVVAGTFSAQQEALLFKLREEIDTLLGERQFVDYDEAEAVCASLARRLIHAVGHETICAGQFAAIPRGGFIVLGMLAYHLELRHDQLTTFDAADAKKTLFVVDDCSLSGTRFRDVLDHIAGDSVVFCPLFAPDALCSGIVSCEPRVTHCIAGASLKDTSPSPEQKGYDDWHRRRTAQLDDNAYWLGQPLGVAFAWCTPQTRLWDAGSECFVEGWEVVPPSRCLKRRIVRDRLLGDEIATWLPDFALIAQDTPGEIRAGNRVLWFSRGEEIIVSNIPGCASDAAPVYCLQDMSALIWRSVLMLGTTQAVIPMLLSRYEVSREALERDLDAFLSQMLADGLLVRVTQSQHASSLVGQDAG